MDEARVSGVGRAVSYFQQVCKYVIDSISQYTLQINTY